MLEKLPKPSLEEKLESRMLQCWRKHYTSVVKKLSRHSCWLKENLTYFSLDVSDQPLLYRCKLCFYCMEVNTCLLLTSDQFLLQYMWFKPMSHLNSQQPLWGLWGLLLYLFSVIYLSLTCSCVWVYMCVCLSTEKAGQLSSPTQQFIYIQLRDVS